MQTIQSQPPKTLTACGTGLATSAQPLAELLRHPALANLVTEVTEPLQIGGLTINPGRNGTLTFIAPAEVVIPERYRDQISEFRVGTERGLCLVHMKGFVINHECRDERGIGVGPSCSLRSDLYEGAVLEAINSRQRTS